VLMKSHSVGLVMIREIICPGGIFTHLVFVRFMLPSGMMLLLRTGGIRACVRLG
jgi:hypothetical protein